MTGKDENALLPLLAAYLSQNMGLNFPAERHNQLKEGMGRAARDFGFAGVESCAEWLMSSPLNRHRIEVLASHLTVGETYFFREKRALAVLQKEILSELRARHADDRTLRIWSAGCASGEEPYSIAISLLEAMPDIVDWNITILATDINPDALEKAAAGRYGQWSFRDCPPLLKEKYFKDQGNKTFEIRPDIKKMVLFNYHNLAADPFPSVFNNTNAMDVIFCRNVLMYFTPPMVNQVSEKLYHSLSDEGWLALSVTETTPVFQSRFQISAYPHCMIYRKSQNTQIRREFQAESEPLQLAVSDIKTPFRNQSPQVSDNQASASGSQPTQTPEVQNSRGVVKTDFFEMARDLFRNGRYAEAEKVTGNLLKNQPQESAVLALHAKTLANRGRLAEANHWCQKALAIDKLNPVNHYLLATIWHEQGQIGESANSLNRAVYLDPNFALAYFALGNLSLRLGKSLEAQKYFRNALSILKVCSPDEIVPESDGITAGRLAEIINAYSKKIR